jgi:signal transduction histidine kinase
MAFGDYDMLLRVLINLLGNSIKFTPAQGQIEVAVGLCLWEQPRPVFPFPEPAPPAGPRSRGDGQEWLVGIRDTGEGIHPEELQTIFDKFIQSSRQTEKNRGGTGLGLSICRGIVEAHGGRIWAESPGPGQGSTFYFTLPVSRMELAEESPRNKEGESCDK